MTQTEKNVAGILRQLRIYLDARFDHAGRLNPKYRQVEADVKWHEMDSVHHVLARKKPVSEFRIAVADLMVSYDFEVRRAIFMPKGQLSILNEVVPIQDDLLKGKAGGGFAVFDLMTLYSAIDTSLRSIVELMQTWVWWDLPDSVTAYMFDSAVERLITIGRSNLDEPALQYYKTTDFKGGPPPPNLASKQSIMEFEFYRAEDSLAGFEKRRLEDGKHQQIIAREASGPQINSEIVTLIPQMAQHIRALEMLSASEEIDASLRDYFSKALQCPPAEVQRGKALEYENRYMAKAKKELLQALMQEGGGEPYDLKLRQYHEMKKKLEYLRGEIKPAPRQAAGGAKEAHGDD